MNYLKASPKKLKEYKPSKANMYQSYLDYQNGALKYKQDEVKKILDGMPDLVAFIEHKDEVQKFNNHMMLTGYLLLQDERFRNNKAELHEQIKKFTAAFRGNKAQSGGFDTLAKKECEKLGISYKQIKAMRQEPKDHAKAAANDREPAYQEAVDMFSNAKTVKMF